MQLTYKSDGMMTAQRHVCTGDAAMRSILSVSRPDNKHIGRMQAAPGHTIWSYPTWIKLGRWVTDYHAFSLSHTHTYGSAASDNASFSGVLDAASTACKKPFERQ